MEMKNLFTICFLTILSLSFASAIVVDAEYITLFPGESKRITIEIDNNENFDIEDISVQLVLSSLLPDGTPVSLPFTVIGSSERDIDDIREDRDETVSFTIHASTGITPGDYNIPYLVTYFEENEDEELTKQGIFAIRVSAETELDFVVDVRDNAILGREGRVSLEIINEGLGEIKSVAVQILPQDFELLSKNKIFVGTIDADDTDIASFDVIFKNTNPIFRAIVTYKDFDNKEHSENVNIPFKVYTEKEAIELGIIKKSRVGLYLWVIAALLIIWVIYRRAKKSRRNKKNKS